MKSAIYCEIRVKVKQSRGAGRALPTYMLVLLLAPIGAVKRSLRDIVRFRQHSCQS